MKVGGLKINENNSYKSHNITSPCPSLVRRGPNYSRYYIGIAT